MTGGLLEPLFRIAPNLYVGPKYMGAGMHVRIDVDPATSPVKIPTNAIDTTYSELGLHVQWDTRDSQFYPRKGHVANFEVAFHDPAIGDDFAYQVFKVSYNGYVSLAANQVLAFRVMGQFENGDVPFYALCQFGRGSDLRGYDIGQFQDKQMLAGQVEYRHKITKRFGAVAFGGVGEVAPSLSALNWDNLLPSGGAGLRYVLAEKNHVALRFDVAWGKTDGPKFYLAVGEAF
jgi:outer membrane protein assembly factor BamA